MANNSSGAAFHIPKMERAPSLAFPATEMTARMLAVKDRGSITSAFYSVMGKVRFVSSNLKCFLSPALLEFEANWLA